MSKKSPASTIAIVVATLAVGLIVGAIAGTYGTSRGSIDPSWFGFAKYKLVLPDSTRYAAANVGTDANGNARIGATNAPVTLTEYSDFQCPYCERMFGAAYGDIVKNYIATGKASLTFRHFPLGFHPHAQKAAEAAECAGKQNAFWPMHDAIFLNQTAWANSEQAVDMFKDMANQLNLDTSDFNACLDSDATKSKVEADLAAGTTAGVNGTPTIFVNDLAISGAMPFGAFAEVIDATINKDEAKLKEVRDALSKR